MQSNVKTLRQAKLESILLNIFAVAFTRTLDWRIAAIKSGKIINKCTQCLLKEASYRITGKYFSNISPVGGGSPLPYSSERCTDLSSFFTARFSHKPQPPIFLMEPPIQKTTNKPRGTQWLMLLVFTAVKHLDTTCTSSLDTC